MAEPVTAYLGLGGNLGDRLAALTEALQLLDSTSGICRTACSSIYETEPWGVTDQPSFLNLVAAFETTLEPVNLLTVCKCVEATVGRTASYRWGPRLIDVDILLYGDRIVSVADPDLQIPHPRMTNAPSYWSRWRRSRLISPCRELRFHSKPAGRYIREGRCNSVGACSLTVKVSFAKTTLRHRSVRYT